MKSVALINRQSSLLVGLALCMNILFLYLYNPKVYFAITQAHGQIGYNFCNYNVIGMNSALTEKMNSLMRAQGSLIDYNAVDVPRAVQYEPFPINDTVAYGMLLGLIWKITGSLKFYDIQMLQIIIFSLLMLIYYQVAYLLFGSMQIAFCCGIAQLLFFPLLAYNVMPVRDVWAYYGLLILCYAVLSYLFCQINAIALTVNLTFFSLCQWMRPTLSCALMMMSIFLITYAIKTSKMRAITLIGYMWAVSLVFFWLPFSYYNYTTYGRCMVSPAGQSLLEGLGELPNRWGHKLNDEYVNDYIGAKYHLVYGTVAFDDMAMHEFKQCVHEDPWHYIKTLIYRLLDIFFPGLQWIFYEQSPYAGCNGVFEKLIVVFSSVHNIIDFMLRHIWMRLYLMVAYVGLILMLVRKRYFAVAFIATCLISGLSTYPSHIEYRYIVPFYWMISLFVGFLLYDIITRFENMFNLYGKEISMKRCIALLLLAVGTVKCDMHDFDAADLEKSYKKAQEHKEHCDRVAKAITEVMTVKRCENIVRDFASANSQEFQRATGTILDDIRVKISDEDRRKVGKIIKKVGAIFELLSGPDADSERVAMQVQAKLMVLNRLVAPYIKACEKHVDDKKIGAESQQAAQEIVQKLFSELKTFCAEQQKRFEEK